MIVFGTLEAASLGVLAFSLHICYHYWTQVHRDLSQETQVQSLQEESSSPPPFHEFGLVADLDKHSKHASELIWTSWLKKGTLIRHPFDEDEYQERLAALQNQEAGDKGQSAECELQGLEALREHGFYFSVRWGKTLPLTSNLATQNRSMELSDLVWFDHKLLVVCDYSGIVYKLRPGEGHVFPRFILADGNGKRQKTMKAEWMTQKDDRLYVGSQGKEWIKPSDVAGAEAATVDGTRVAPQFLDFGGEWVKTITAKGSVRARNWRNVYRMMRNATNTAWPGYLTHEAVLFDNATRKWVFLPRKESREMFSNEGDELKGSTSLLLVDENLRKVEKVTQVCASSLETVGQYGFTTVAAVPFSEGLLLVVKVKEVEEGGEGFTASNRECPQPPQEIRSSPNEEREDEVDCDFCEGTAARCNLGPIHSMLAVMDMQGRILTDPPWIGISDRVKFEGAEFLDG